LLADSLKDKMRDIFVGKQTQIGSCLLSSLLSFIMSKYFLSVVFGIVICSCTFAQGKLVFAIDIVRHGDRTPLIASPGMEKIWPQGVGQFSSSRQPLNVQ
jgi:hypothetical protein